MQGEVELLIDKAEIERAGLKPRDVAEEFALSLAGAFNRIDPVGCCGDSEGLAG